MRAWPPTVRDGHLSGRGCSDLCSSAEEEAEAKQQDADDDPGYDHGYDTATYTEGPNHVRPLARPKVKEEEERD